MLFPNGHKIVFKAGELVEESIPLAAGDITPKVGLILGVRTLDNYSSLIYKVLFPNGTEDRFCNEIKKIETNIR